MIKAWVLNVAIAIAQVLLEFAVKHGASPDTAAASGGPPGERERLLRVIRDRLRAAQGGAGAPNQRRDDAGGTG